MKYIFDTNVAKICGLREAIVLENLFFWIKKNEANQVHYYDGKYWTYNSLKAFEELFPFFTRRQIEYTLNKLVENDLILKGNYNKVVTDRTLWYALTEKGKCILQNGEIDFTKAGFPFHKSVKSIPYINNAYINTNINNNNIEKENIIKEKELGNGRDIVKEIITYLNLKANTNYRPNTNKTKSLINARLNEGFTLEDFKTVIDKKSNEWLGSDYEKFLRPETLFGNKFENYLNQNVSNKVNRFKPNAIENKYKDEEF